MRNRYREKQKNPLVKKILKEVIIFLIEAAIVVGLAYCVIEFALEKTEITGSSMEATLSDSDQIIIDKFSYHFHEPQRFDVIVFKQNNREHGYYNVKRVIGLPGETIQIKDGLIYINGEEVKDKISCDTMNTGGLAEEPILLEENEYFVLGDNRNNSEDSRFANVGNVIRNEIIGKAWIQINPFNFVSKKNLLDKNQKEIE